MAKASSPEVSSNGPWEMRSATCADAARFSKPADFVNALRQAMTKARDIEGLFDIWEENVVNVRELNASRKQLGLDPGFAAVSLPI